MKKAKLFGLTINEFDIGVFMNCTYAFIHEEVNNQDLFIISCNGIDIFVTTYYNKEITVCEEIMEDGKPIKEILLTRAY